jgi:hypothetical protein
MHLDNCVLATALYAETLEVVLGLVGKGILHRPTPVKSIAALGGVSSSRLPTLLDALRTGEAAGAFEEGPAGEWRALCTVEEAGELRLMLRGIALYRKNVHRDDDTVVVVV